MPEFLFVYGTLLKQSNLLIANFLEQNSTAVSEGSFPGVLYDIGDYPGAVYMPDSKMNVYGKILQISNSIETFNKLDAYEETGLEFEQPNEYLRKKILVKTIDGETIECWTYLYNHSIENKELIISGRYFDKRIWLSFDFFYF